MAGKYQAFFCPITHDLFHDPVIAEDGHTYERAAIETWITENGTSPLTREKITIEKLLPNRLVKALAADLQKTVSSHNYKFKLNLDIERAKQPFFHTTGKSLYDATWIGNPGGQKITLLKLSGARAEREASFYEHLTRHPYIVYTYGLVQPASDNDSSTSLMILQEKAPQGNLHNLLENRQEECGQKPFSDALLNQIFLQITNAMVFLAKENIIHGDLACRNVLVFHIDENKPEQTLVKLTDFGISRGNSMYSRIQGVETAIDIIPIRSTPHEVFEDNQYSEKSDIYAMGVLMWEAYSNGKVPWDKISKESEVRQKVIKGECLPRPTQCKLDHQWELMLKCMSKEPKDRPTFVQLEKELTDLKSQLKDSISLKTPKSNIIPDEITNTREESEKSISIPSSVVITSIISSSDSANNQETQQESPTDSVPKVKDIRKMFERKSSEQDQAKLCYRSKTKLDGKRSSLQPSPRETICTATTPSEDLIKLTKWN